jgi:hypothetical protein
MNRGSKNYKKICLNSFEIQRIYLYLQRKSKTKTQMTELVLTKAARLRMHEDSRIAAEYRAMRAAYPAASTGRIIDSLAQSGNFKSKSFAGIRAALIRAGELKPQPRA